jgi:single-stranded-DNA-specific exonuclease
LTQLGHLFEKFGGHAHAAGFTLKAAKLDILKSELELIARETLDDEDLLPVIDVDAEISFKDITPEMVGQVKALSPFGEGNPEPLFLARSLEVLGSWIVGENHLKLRLRQGGATHEAIGFGLADRHPLDGSIVNVVFIPEINQWQGYERVQLRVVDIQA